MKFFALTVLAMIASMKFRMLLDPLIDIINERSGISVHLTKIERYDAYYLLALLNRR